MSAICIDSFSLATNWRIIYKIRNRVEIKLFNIFLLKFDILLK